MHPILKFGAQGPDVKILQAALNQAGFPVNAVDGIFGPSTLGAVKSFQTAHKLVSDGIVGPMTWAAFDGSTPQPVPTPTTKLHGIDVSGYDPHTDWGRVAAAGISFAFIKATEGYTYVNPYFKTDWRASRSAGVLRGAYHFFRPHDSGAEQAKHFLEVIGADAAGMIRPVLDWEVGDGVSGPEQKKQVSAFLEYVKAHLNVDCFLYYSASWPKNFLGGLSEYAANPKWIAQYASHCSIPYDIWQYTDKAHVDGVQVPCDGSVFDGNLESFKSKFVT